MTTYGYARVSADGQTLVAQDAALRGAGCAKVFAEKASGAKTDRAELRKALARLGDSDVLMVTRLDRLARSTRDLLNTLDEIAKRGAGFKSLADTWADTTTPHGRLMLTVLGGLAEFERELIKTRTGEGRAARAKAAGVHMGRPSKLTPHQQREALAKARGRGGPHGYRPDVWREPYDDLQASLAPGTGRTISRKPSCLISRSHNFLRPAFSALSAFWLRSRVTSAAAVVC